MINFLKRKKKRSKQSKAKHGQVSEKSNSASGRRADRPAITHFKRNLCQLTAPGESLPLKALGAEVWEQLPCSFQPCVAWAPVCVCILVFEEKIFKR